MNMNKRNIQPLSRVRGEINISRETDYIIAKAEHRDARLVLFGSLVLFSTKTGDAWMLDPNDQLALCLAIDGVRHKFNVCDTQENYQIEWSARYAIDGEAFIVIPHGEGKRVILGYPTNKIQRELKHRPRLDSHDNGAK